MGLPALTNLSLFSGAGGLDLAARWTGRVRTVCYVEIDPYAQAVLQTRIRSGDLDDAPIWDDIKTFDATAYRGVEIVSGGFPCQPASSAGRRKGMADERWLWPEFARVIREARPRFVLAENVPGLLSVNAGAGFGEVLRDLAQAGYDAEWCVRSAADVGAPHLRERVWLIAYTRGHEYKSGRSSEQRTKPEGFHETDMANPHDGPGGQQSRQPQETRPEVAFSVRSKRFASVADATGPRCTPGGSSESLAVRDSTLGQEFERRGGGQAWWATEPDVGRVAHGVASRVDRLRCLGNGVVPQQALPAWERILELAGMKRKR